MFSALRSKFNTTYRVTLLFHRKYSTNHTSTSNEAMVTISQNFKLEQIMDQLPPEAGALSPNDTLNIIRQLSKTSKDLQDSSSSASINVIKHNKFSILQEAMNASVSYLKIHDKFDMLKSSETLCIPLSDKIFNGILHSLLDNIHNMSLNEIMMFDCLLAKKEKTKLIRQLNENFINRFNIKTSQQRIRFNYFKHIRRIIQFIDRNRNEIINKVFENLGNCLAKSNADLLTANEAMDTIICLSSFGYECEYFKPLLQQAFNVWQQTDVTVDMVETTLTLLFRRNMQSMLNYDLYNDEQFIDKCAEVVIKNGSLENCMSVQYKLNRLNFINKSLTEYLLKMLYDGNVTGNLKHHCITMFKACEIANYKPPLFNIYLSPTIAAQKFQFDINLDWAHFAVRLNDFGIYHKSLVEMILRQRYYQKFNADSLSELESMEVDKVICYGFNIRRLIFNLKKTLGDSIRLLVRGNNDITIPMLVKIDTISKCFVPFEKTETNSLASIRCNDDQCLIAIVDESSPDVQLLHSNLVTIPLNGVQWMKLLQHKTKEKFFSEIVEPDATILSQ